MCSVPPPAPAKTVFVFFKQAVETHRGVQSQAGFLLSPMDFIACAFPTALGPGAPSPASLATGREKGKAEKAAIQAGFSHPPLHSKHS